MQSEFTFWSLILDASLFAIIIMIVLLIMFIITLFLIGKKNSILGRLNRKNKNFNGSFWSEDTNLLDLFDYYKSKESEGIEQIFIAGFGEFLDFNDKKVSNQDVIIKSCRRAMEAALTREVTAQEKDFNILATFSSTAPYIGLLGTVSGIMESFINIGGMQQTSIASVAPGIAEALIATAMGLFVAISSVFAYNFLVDRSLKLIIGYEAFIEEFSNFLQKQF